MFFTKSLASVLATSAMFFSVANAFTGDATFFTPGLGACGIVSTPAELVAALSTTQYGSGGNCGRRIRVTYQGRSIDVTAVDKCPGCAANDIDLSPAAFGALADPAIGRIRVDWYYL